MTREAVGGFMAGAFLASIAWCLVLLKSFKGMWR